MEFPAYAEQIAERLWEAGYEAYMVGGCVRDRLMGREAHDIDMTTSATPEQMLRVFSDLRTLPTGLAHGTLTVLHEGHAVEVTTFRVDGAYSDSRHPDRVTFTASLREDLARRDFTVNAMAYSRHTGLCDPFGGQQDLQAGLLRAVGDPCVRFSEDALRILRAFRFSAQLSFAIEPRTLEGTVLTREGLRHIARERIGSELTRLLLSPAAEQALMQMARCGVLPYVFGEGVTVCIEGLDATPADAMLRLGVLLRHTDEEKIAKALQGLRPSTEQSHRAKRCAAVLAAPLLGTDADARRLMARCGEDTDAIVTAALALGLTDQDFADKVRRNLAAHAPVCVSELAIDGKDLMALGMHGKQIGRTLQELLAYVIEDPHRNEREGLLTYLKQQERNE